MRMKSRPGRLDHPQPYRRDDYLGLYADIHGDPAEPHVKLIQSYAKYGLTKTGHHGVVDAMGVPRTELPTWDDIQFVTAQLHTPPLLDDEPVGTEVVIGPNAQKPLTAENSALRFGYELRLAVGRSQGRARQRRGACRHRHLLRRRRHAGGRASRQQPLFL